jgi:uncharacterized protein
METSTMTTFTPWASLAGGAMIGLAAVVLMAAIGRIAGISGILGRLSPPYEDGDWFARLAFVAGLVVAPLIVRWFGLSPASMQISGNLPVMAAAGLLVGFGSAFGSGCTSGHGVCGLARLSIRSLVATGIFMTTAVVTVFVMRHVVGG